MKIKNYLLAITAASVMIACGEKAEDAHTTEAEGAAPVEHTEEAPAEEAPAELIPAETVTALCDVFTQLEAAQEKMANPEISEEEAAAAQAEMMAIMEPMAALEAEMATLTEAHGEEALTAYMSENCESYKNMVEKMEAEMGEVEAPVEEPAEEEPAH